MSNSEKLIEDLIEEGLVLVGEEKNREARAVWKKVLELDPHNEMAHDYLDSLPAISDDDADSDDFDNSDLPAEKTSKQNNDSDDKRQAEGRADQTSEDESASSDSDDDNLSTESEKLSGSMTEEVDDQQVFPPTLPPPVSLDMLGSESSGDKGAGEDSSEDDESSPDDLPPLPPPPPLPDFPVDNDSDQSLSHDAPFDDLPPPPPPPPPPPLPMPEFPALPDPEFDLSKNEDEQDQTDFPVSKAQDDRQTMGGEGQDEEDELTPPKMPWEDAGPEPKSEKNAESESESAESSDNSDNAEVGDEDSENRTEDPAVTEEAPENETDGGGEQETPTGEDTEQKYENGLGDGPNSEDENDSQADDDHDGSADESAPEDEPAAAPTHSFLDEAPGEAGGLTAPLDDEQTDGDGLGEEESDNLIDDDDDETDFAPAHESGTIDENGNMMDEGRDEDTDSVSEEDHHEGLAPPKELLETSRSAKADELFKIESLSPEIAGLTELFDQGKPETALRLLTELADDRPYDHRPFVALRIASLKFISEFVRNDRVRTSTPRLLINLEESQAHSLTGQTAYLLSMIDGSSSVEELVSILGMEEVEAFRMIAFLIEEELIKLEFE